MESVEKVSPGDKRYDPLTQISPSSQYGPAGSAIPPTTLPKLSPADGKFSAGIFTICHILLALLCNSICQCVDVSCLILTSFYTRLLDVPFTRIFNCCYLNGDTICSQLHQSMCTGYRKATRHACSNETRINDLKNFPPL